MTAPPCQAARRWVEERLGDRHCFAPFTGQDSRAFGAFVHLLELYAAADESGRQSALIAMHWTVASMQEKVEHLAKTVIPMVLDWGDEEPLWQKIQEAG